MSGDQAPRPSPPVGLILLLVAGGFFYLMMLLCIGDLHSPGNDAAGRGIAAGFGFIFGCALWLVLGLMLLIAEVNGNMPAWAAIACLVLWPLSGFAALVSLEFAEHDWEAAPYLWLPLLTPPVLAIYALWARVPALNRALPAPPTSIATLGLVLLLSMAPIPRYAGIQIERAREAAAEKEMAREQAAKEAEQRRQNLERFRKLTADSPLWEWAVFFGKDSEFDAQAVAGAKALAHRQADAEEALRRDMGFPLLEYGRLDLAATPAFCAAAGDFLGREAAAHPAVSADTEYDGKSLPYLEASDIGAIEWLTEHCDIDDTVAQIRSTIEGYKPTRSRDATLALIAWRRGNGFYQHGRHDLDRALREYGEAVRLSPEHEQFRKNRGDVYFDMGRYDDAIADYTEASRLNPGYSEAFYSLGNAYDRKGDDANALAGFEEAIHIAPEYAAAHNNRALIYIREDKLDLATEDLDAALSHAPRFRLALDNRARVRFDQGNYASAADDFAAALKLKPDEPYTVLLLYLARLHAGQDAHGPLAADAVKLDRGKWPYPIVAAWLGDREAAAVQADAADAANPDRKGQTCEADFYFGDEAFAKGDTATARRLMEQALAGCPADYLEAPLAKYELARLLP